MPAPRSRKRFAAALAAALLVPAASLAASGPIYKCLDRNLGINYTDLPCKDGERLDLREGNADPAAIARLERERAAWDQSGAQRLAEERRAYLQRRTYDQPAYLVEGGRGFAYPDAPDYIDYPYAYGYGAYPYAYGYYPYGYGGSAGNDRRRHGDGRDGRFDRRRDHPRAVPTHPQNPRR